MHHSCSALFRLVIQIDTDQSCKFPSYLASSSNQVVDDSTASILSSIIANSAIDQSISEMFADDGGQLPLCVVHAAPTD
jgi:hypothetical protein